MPLTPLRPVLPPEPLRSSVPPLPLEAQEASYFADADRSDSFSLKSINILYKRIGFITRGLIKIVFLVDWYALQQDPRGKSCYIRNNTIKELLMYEYKPRGVCSTKIKFDIRDNKVYDLSFSDGCSGNLQGISILAEGMDAGTLIARFRGVRCGSKNTSCPDQLAMALETAINTGPGEV
jgi:uncharacterized protein (TIGR03905 family)